MIGTLFSRSQRPGRRPPPLWACRHVEQLESRNVPSTFNLTPLVQVSGLSPFLGNPIEASDPPITIDSEIEPYVVVDPTNSNHLVGTWNQDFARGIVAAVSFNGGNSWQSVVIPGVTAASGGTYPHSSNPWLSFAPNGDLYLSLIGHDFPPFGDAVLVSKSTDGGLTWGTPTTVATAGSKDFHDKECITADPTNSQLVYVSWVRYDNNRGVTMFSRTTDGGQTWEPAREIFDAGPKSDTVANQIVVLPDGTLLNFFDLGLSKSTAGTAHFDNKLSLIRSTDHGQTWSSAETPTTVADILSLLDTATIPGTRGVPNPDGGSGIFAPPTFFDAAVDPANGNLYAVWEDARFGEFRYTSIALSMSTDGGFTWSAPIKINQTPDNTPAGNRQAILPSVAVNQVGVVAVTYYDFRNNTPDSGLPTDLWMVHAHPADGFTNPASWSSENRMTPQSFNMESAPMKEGAYFIGDYEGLVAFGKNFGALFSMPTATNSSSIFFRDPLPDAAPPESTAARASGIVDGVSQAHLTFVWSANSNVARWFFDPTPCDDSEFTMPGNQGESNSMDLLTDLAHEFGHVLGYDHEQTEVMEDTLVAGKRRMPSAGDQTDWLAAIDLSFAELPLSKRRR